MIERKEEGEVEDVLHADTSIRVLPSSAMPSTAIISSPERERGDDIRNVCAHASKFMQHTHEAMDVASVGGRGSKESERFSGCMLCVCVCMRLCVCVCVFATACNSALGVCTTGCFVPARNIPDISAEPPGSTPCTCK